MNKGKNNSEKRLRTAGKLLLSIAVGATSMLFPSLEVFLGNQNEFTVGIGYVMLPMLIISAAVSAVLFAVLMILDRIKKTACDIMMCIVFGLLLAMYAQTLLLNGNMKEITGDADYQNEDLGQIAGNLGIYCLLLFAPLIVYLIRRKKPDSRLLNSGEGKIIPYVSALILAMQTVGGISSAAGGHISRYDHNFREYLAVEPVLSLSEDENIIVFLTDRMDCLWTEDVIERYPEFAGKLDDFTLYQNNISHNTNTFPSVPQMLTWHYYKGEEWYEYLDEAWSGETLPKKLNDNGWEVSLILDKLTTYNDCGQLKDVCDNVRKCSEDECRVNYTGKGGIVPTMTRFSFSRFLPYAFKYYAEDKLSSDFSNTFVDYDVEWMIDQATSASTDIKFKEFLDNNSVRADSGKKRFLFIHLNGAHGVDEEEISFYEDHDKYNNDYQATLRGCFEILFEYMEQMKEAGVYDNSTIIILGDHGRVSGLNNDFSELAFPIMTGLMIKPASGNGDPLAYDRYSQLSNDQFGSSVLEYAGIDHSDKGLSYQDVISGGLDIERYMQTFYWERAGSVSYRNLYKVTGDARDFDNWEVQPEHE